MRCSVCVESNKNNSAVYETKEQLEAHISGFHFNYVPYECGYCLFSKFPTEYSLRVHHDAAHKGQHLKMIFNNEIAYPDRKFQIQSAMLNSIGNISIENNETSNNFDSTDTSDVNAQSTSALDEIWLQCSSCQEYVSPQCSQQIEHVNVRHCQFPIYSCGLCDVAFTSILHFDSHCTLTHLDGNFSLQSNFDRFAVELSSKCQIYFRRNLALSKCRNAIEDPKPSIKKRKSSGSLTTSLDQDKAVTISSYERSKGPSKRKVGSSLICSVCKKLISNILLNLLMHMNKHIKYPIRRCVPCNEVFLYTSGNATTHVRHFHNNDFSVIENNSKKYNQKLRDRIYEFFPDYVAT